MTILGIETSCDETACAIVKDGKILSNIVSSQVNLHKKYGGVYPELASRAHLENILPALKGALEKANSQLESLDYLAVTIGPGLIGSLLVGVNTARTLSYIFNKPIIPVHHLEAHIYANLLKKTQIFFPALCLIVSGGHTSLILMKNHGQYQILGETLDDAAGEAFDKVAKLLDLGYPGGPAIEAEASKLKSKNEKLKIKLPRPMLDSPNFNFSFSGLKTSALYLVKQMSEKQIKNVRRQIAREFQQAVIDVLVSKTFKAAKKHKVKSVLLGGGVAANKLLRKEIKKFFPSFSLLIPPSYLCTDNGVMVAICGYFKALKKKFQKWYDIKAEADAKLENW